MTTISGGRAVVELLKAEGVRYVFGIVGSTFLDVLDTLYDDKAIEYVNVRHEQAAAFMADGLARVTGLPGEHPLWGLSNVLLTPHMAGHGPYLDERRFEIMAENCRAFAAGHPLRNQVDKASWF